jgi:hypothetical protein
MKTIEQSIDNQMSEEKKIEIIADINGMWDEYYTKGELAEAIENGYIFGPMGENEHYKRDEIMALINEVELEKTPVQTVEVSEEL